MLPGPIVPVLFGQSEVDEEEFVAVPADPHQKVVGLDVPMDEVLVVDVLDPTNHLIGEHQHCLHGESEKDQSEIFTALKPIFFFRFGHHQVLM